MGLCKEVEFWISHKYVVEERGKRKEERFKSSENKVLVLTIYYAEEKRLLTRNEIRTKCYTKNCGTRIGPSGSLGFSANPDKYYQIY